MIEGTAQVPRARLAELITRRDLQIGHELAVGVRNGGRGRGKIVSVDEASVAIDFRCAERSPNLLPIEVIVAIPRPQILKRLLRDIAMIGLSKLSLVRSSLTDKNYLKSHALTESAIFEHLRLGLEQAAITVAPTVQIFSSWREFANDWQRAPGSAADLKILACPSGTTSVAEVCCRSVWSKAENARAVAAIGPERGWTDQERGWFVEQGFNVVTFSPRILRVDVAVNFLAGMLEGMRLDSRHG